MDISGIGQANGIDYISALNNRRNRSYANQTSSFASNADTVSISSEAMEMFQTSKNSAQKSVSEEITDWYNQYMTVEGQVAPYPEIDSWLPENRELLYEIWDEQTALANAYPDPINRPEEITEKLSANSRKIAILETFGESRVVTDGVMQEGLAAYDKAEKEHLEKKNDPANVSLTELAMKKYEDPEELEKKLKEWQEKQISGQTSSGTSLDSKDDENNGLAVSSTDDSQTVNNRETKKSAMYKLADYIADAPRNTTIIERTNVPAATKVWIDVPLEMAEAMESNK